MSASFLHHRPMWLTLRKGLMAGVALAALGLVAAAPAAAQTLNERLTQRQAADKNSRMLVDAREVIYDRDKDRVSAVGDVQIYYQGRVLEADRVTYDRKTKRIYAEGNARLTESDGTKTFGDRFDLTDDFKDGFIDSLRVETTTANRLSASRAERTGGETTVFDRGTFTGCAPCKENPERPPLWQVKAARIIHNNSEQRIYYENATLEFWGVPVAWFPFFSAPDPTVKRKSGVLAPRLVSRTKLGYGASVPLYWAAAQNYDVTFTPTVLSRQGVHLDVLWRHRLENGSYNIRVNGINQLDRRAFETPAYLGAGDKTFRGSVESRGKFFLNEKWTFGWDGAFATDKFYFTDYKIKPANIGESFYKEVISQAYLRGRGQRSWFDLSAYHFLGLSTADWQPQIGTATPVLDFDRRFTPDTIGGELRVNVNAAFINRDAAYYQPLPQAGQTNFAPQLLVYSNNDGQYFACRYSDFTTGLVTGAYRPGQCLLRGFAGQYARASADVTWRRRFIDPLGQEWTPFFGVRGDVASLQVNQSGYNAPANSFGGTGYGNFQQGSFFGGNADNYLARFMPTAGLEYRYPFFAAHSYGTHFFEPIAQIIVRPNEQRIGNMPNEDAQSLVFDENSLFSWNKFSGYDRIEGGTRFNYGGRYTFTGNNGMLASLLFGQSVHVAGRNSFAQYDLANTGRDSGLESGSSDFIGAATFQPTALTSFSARTRFDDQNFALKRIDLEAKTRIFGLATVSAIYSRIAEQPELGYTQRREGLFLTGLVTLPRQFYATGSVVFDLDRYLTQKVANPASDVSRWSVAGAVVGLGYKDECTDFSLTVARAYSSASTGQDPRITTFLMKLTLKDLGETSLSQRTGN